LALGVVFGDLGTSPIYTIQTVFNPSDPHPVAVTRDSVFGHFSTAFFSLAAVVLAVTGAEALYADLGHFGRAPITRAWLLLVAPTCVLSYMGQGALVLGDPSKSGGAFSCWCPTGAGCRWSSSQRPRP
jgi:K+ transporter